MKLSNQAIGALMMALQKSLIEQSDIVPTLKEMKFQQMDNGELMVENPPHFSAEYAPSTPNAYSQPPPGTHKVQNYAPNAPKASI